MQINNSLPYLLNMVGRNVKVYKGGPESKIGCLLTVKDDFIALELVDNQIVYYQLKHIKSIVENAKSSLAYSIPNQQLNIEQLNNFNDVLMNFVDRQIQINSGGPDSKIGTLLNVKSDHLVLNTGNNGLVYYQLEHVKSVSAAVLNEDNTTEIVNNEKPLFINADSFPDLIGKMQHNWTRISSGGPEKVEGILVEYTNNHVVVVHHEDVYLLDLFHINNITPVLDNNNQQTENGTESASDNQNNVKGEQQKENKKSSNKQKEVKTSNNKRDKQGQEKDEKKKEGNTRNTKEQKKEKTTSSKNDSKNKQSKDKKDEKEKQKKNK